MSCPIAEKPSYANEHRHMKEIGLPILNYWTSVYEHFRLFVY